MPHPALPFHLTAICACGASKQKIPAIITATAENLFMLFRLSLKLLKIYAVINQIFSRSGQAP
jgi:hypothetical protein